MQQPSESCPSEEQLLGYVNDSLTDETIPWVGSHIDACELCQQRLAAVDRLPSGLRQTLREESIRPPDIPGYTYRIKNGWPEELGRGGMGVVFKARQHGTNRDVALKMILTGALAGGSELARFRTEAQVLGRSQHPNVVQVFEVGECKGQLFFSMEFVDGESLDKELGDKPYPSVKGAAKLTHTLALALESCHDKQIVHRDLTPGNILLTKDGTPKISDFGLAKRLDVPETLTLSDHIVGKPPFMAPEQVVRERSPVAPSADIYSLGAILYKMLTGRPPFIGLNTLDTLMQVVAQDPVSPKSLQPTVPSDLETICLKCLEKEPSKRYASAKHLADDLGRFLKGEPILARPASVHERLLKWARRKPSQALAAGSVLAVVVVSLIAAIALFVAWNTAREEAANARLQRNRAEIEANDANEALAQLAPAAIAAMDGDQKAAGDVFGKAVALWERRVQRTSDDNRARNHLLQARMHLGNWHMLRGEPEKAIAIFVACEEEFAILRQQDPNNPMSRFQLANCLDNHGMALLLLEKYDDAVVQHRKALEHRLILSALSGERQALFQAYQASTENHLGNARWEGGHPNEAAEHYQKSINLLRALIGAQPNVPSHRQELAYSLLGLGQLRLSEGKREAAQTSIDEAIALQEALHQADPSNTAYSLEVAVGHLGRANVHRQCNKPAAALAEYQSASRLIAPVLEQSPDHAARRHWVEAQAGEAWALFRLDDKEKALQATDAASGSCDSPHVGSATRVKVAAALALASSATQADSPRSAAYATRAISLVEQARQQGFFNVPSNQKELLTDEDLTSLRGNTRFQGVLGKLPRLAKAGE